LYARFELMLRALPQPAAARAAMRSMQNAERAWKLA
jgi:hypothetical protein